MRVVVIGIGGVGGYYGGKLAMRARHDEGLEVIFVARGRNLEQIQKKGLKLITDEGEFVAHPTRAADNTEEAGTADLIIFCVKGYDLEESARLVSRNLKKRTAVLPLLNGVNNAEKLKALLPGCKILNGCVYISTSIVEPGTVRQAGGSCQLFFGPEDGNIDNFMEIERLFKDAGIKAELKTNIKEVVWEKYIFVCPMASVTSLLRQPFGALMENEESRDLIEGLMREIELIARAKDVGLAEDVVESSLKKASAFPYDTKTSMQLDFEKAQKTELEIFTGYVVKAGGELGIEVPLHQRVYSRLKADQ